MTWEETITYLSTSWTDVRGVSPPVTLTFRMLLPLAYGRIISATRLLKRYIFIESM